MVGSKDRISFVEGLSSLPLISTSSFAYSATSAEENRTNWAVKRVGFLGHILKPQGISPDPNKIEAIKNYPAPKKLKQVKKLKNS